MKFKKHHKNKEKTSFINDGHKISAGFTRKIEDFACGHCGATVMGNGYTNHCPRCLWSKHVDHSPGDRENKCQGMMKPIRVELDHGEYIIIHQCEICGEVKKNKSNPHDDFEDILKLSAQI